MSAEKVTNEKNRKSNYVALIALAIVVVTGMLALVGGKIIIANLPLAEEVRIEFPVPGTTLVKKGERNDKASLLLAASDLWTNTGVVLNPQQSVTITASGRVNLAIHRLTEACFGDYRPKQTWIGPNGRKEGVRQEYKDTHRNELKIAPRVDGGTLLACLHREGEPIPCKINPKPDNIIVIGSKGKLRNTNDTKCTIWLVVNDAVLENNDLSRRAYLEITEDSDPKIYSRPKGCENLPSVNEPRCRTPIAKWKYIVEQQYWDIWFEDNIGFFQVQMVFDTEAGT